MNKLILFFFGFFIFSSLSGKNYQLLSSDNKTEVQIQVEPTVLLQEFRNSSLLFELEDFSLNFKDNKIFIFLNKHYTK